MIVADIMSKTMVTVSSDTPFKEIWAKIFSKKIHSLPVVDKNKKLIGLITREDLLKPLYPKYQDVMENLETMSDFEEMEERIEEMVTLRARDVMSKKVIFTRESTLIMRALSRMIVRDLAQLPVVREDDVVIGIVTKGDVFYSLFKKHFARKKSGAAKKKSATRD